MSLEKYIFEDSLSLDSPIPMFFGENQRWQLKLQKRDVLLTWSYLDIKKMFDLPRYKPERGNGNSQKHERKQLIKTHCLQCSKKITIQKTEGIDFKRINTATSWNKGGTSPAFSRRIHLCVRAMISKYV